MNKRIFYPIPSLCKCGCNEIVWNGKEWVNHHWAKINSCMKVNIGKNHWNYGNHWSEEVKQKISKSLIGKLVGEKNPNYGNKYSEETRKLLSEKKKGIFEKENNPNWKGGLSFEPYCEKFTKKVRREIRNKFNNKCFICNRHQKDNLTKNGKIWSLSIHHVYYDKEEGCNGKNFSLIPLCLECHGKTNYDRKYWEKFLINKLEVIHA